MALPKRVIEKDYELSEAHDELMELRWKWTMDPSNAKAVSFAEYAREVGRDPSVIRRDATGWDKYQQSLEKAGSSLTASPGAATTPYEFRELAALSEERQQAAQAVAKHTGNKVGHVARNKRQQVDVVVDRAHRAAEKRGTTVEHEIDKAAEWQAKAERVAERDRRERKQRHTSQFLQIEGKIGAMLARGREVLALAEDIPFSASSAVAVLPESW